MKFKFLTLFFVMFFTHTFAQNYDIKVTKCYINLNFTQQNLSLKDYTYVTCLPFKEKALPTLFKSNYGAAFTAGRTFFVNRNQPIGGVLRFGIDATWADLNYANYTIRDADEKETLHQGEIGMHVGPSFVVSPIKALNVHGYFRYAPTFSAVYAVSSKDLTGGYASFFMTGLSVSYGVIGIGLEKRWGNGSYKEMFKNENNNGGSEFEDLYKRAIKLKTSGYRFYITFRF